MNDYLKLTALPWLYIAVGGGIQIAVLLTVLGSNRWMTIMSIALILYGAAGLYRLRK